MRTLLVYESMFGNTRDVASAIAEALAKTGPVSLLEVGTAPAIVGSDVDLLVVGGPTHAFSMSRPATRADAARQAGDGVLSPRGIRDWLDDVDLPTPRPLVATFDTRINKPTWLTGSAAKAAAKRLRASGCRLAAAPKSFFVAGTPGPLADGERDRARAWGRTLQTSTSGAGREEHAITGEDR